MSKLWHLIVMKRFFFFVSVVSCLLIPMTLAAQDRVPVRSGVHDAFSRLVFDWTGPVKFFLYRADDGTLTVSFDRKAELDRSQFSPDPGGTVRNVKVLSTDPLRVLFDIPADSEVKAFYVERRVVLDIYNPSPKTPSPPPPPPPQVALENQRPGYAPGTALDHAVTRRVAETTKDVDILPDRDTDIVVEKIVEKPVTERREAAAPMTPTPEKPPAYVLVEENQAKKPAAVPLVPVEKEPHPAHPAQEHPAEKKTVLSGYDLEDRQHVLTVTSTSAVGMAVFENLGDLWLITDQNNHHLEPKINGPHPEIFPPFEEISPDMGMAYRTRLPAGVKVRGDGGDLMWRVIVSGEMKAGEPVLPLREASDGLERGGTMIWPFEKPGRLLTLEDPMTGQSLKVVTVSEAKDFAGPRQDFVDFEVLPSPVGLVIRPKVDDLDVSITGRGVEISRPGGLALLPDKKMSLLYPETTRAGKEQEKPHGAAAKQRAENTGPRVFNFEEWQMGDISVLNHNKNAILANLNQANESGKVEDLITLAKMNLSHGRGAEAIGFLTYALEEMPALDKNAEFVALRGVANAFDRKSEVALGDLLNPMLKPYEEIEYWKAFVLADLGDWQQAAEVLPEHFGTLYDYPDDISHRLALVLAEIVLRAGKVDEADELLALLEHRQSKLSDPLNAALKYLQGEAARQRGDVQKTVDLWQELTKGPDDLYRAKAGLALTRLLEENGQIDNKKAIDRLERLRYAWRGDELEAQIDYWLGRAYIKDKAYLKGLMSMRDAASIAVDTDLGHRITAEMTQTFTDLFLGEGLKDLSPLDAVALYEQFSELTPAGEKGDRLVQALAEHLVQADLLGRAATLLKHQVDHRLHGEEKARVAVRLAAILLLDKRPDKAMVALKTAEKTQGELPESPQKTARERQIALLKARALGQGGRADQALALLKTLGPGIDQSKLKADIAWQAGYWQDAGEALQDVLLDEKISPQRPLTDRQKDLVMNRAIALSLAGDRIALANMREKYSGLMAQTDKAHQFEVITRQRQSGRLADRETLMSVVSEVDLFKELLEGYREDGNAP